MCSQRKYQTQQGYKCIVEQNAFYSDTAKKLINFNLFILMRVLKSILLKIWNGLCLGVAAKLKRSLSS